MTTADVTFAAALPRWRYSAAILLPLAVAITLAVVGAFGTYFSMTPPLRLLHFVSVALVIGGLAFALSESTRRFWFGGALPFWAMLAIAFVTVFVALLVIFPLLGHATWHLYRRVIA